MIRLSAQPIRHRLLIAATMVASAVVLLLVGLEYGSRVPSPETAVRQSAPATVSTGSASGNQLSFLSSISPTLCLRSAFKTIRAMI